MNYLTATEVEYELITEPERALEVIKSLDHNEKYALDFETTALHPKDGKVRLTQIYNDDVSYLFDHEFCGSFRSLAKHMIGPTYVAFYHCFEGKWFEDVCPYEVTLWDVGIMRKSRLGGGQFSLAIMAKRDLKIDMDKGLQNSGWSNPRLTKEQYQYAMFDSYVTWQLFKKWRAEMTPSNWNGFHGINDVWRANNEMEETGLVLDSVYHLKNIKTWELKRDTCKRYFERFTPTSVIKNINSNQQISDFLKRELDEKTIALWPRTPSSGKVGKRTGRVSKDYLSMERDVCIQACNRLPYPMSRWLAAFVVYRKWSKYLSTYGDALVTQQALSGRISSRFNIAAAITMRYSSSSSNLQNIPRQEYIRKAFTARRYDGVTKYRLALADYSGIEVRVLAELSGDEQLLEDCIYGDVHAGGAATINNEDYEYYRAVLADKDHKRNRQFKSWRSTAKVFVFRLLYGAGAGALAASLKSTPDEAKDAIIAWADRYPKAYQYRYQMMDVMHNTGFLPVVDGRTIYVRKPDRQLPVAANYPVQGAAASVMYRALYHIHKLLWENEVDAKLCATIHDEVIINATDDDCEIALDCLNEGMRLGWLDIFPSSNTDNLGDSAIGENWSAKP